MSNWVCVARRAEWRAARRGEDGGEEGALIKRRQIRVERKDGWYVHALIEEVDRLVDGRIP